MNGTDAPAAPLAELRPALRVGTAILVVVLMVLSGATIAILSSGDAAATNAPASPLTSAAPAAKSPIETGQQLQQGPYLKNPGTPVSTIPNASLLGPVAPGQEVAFTVGFQMRNTQLLQNIISEQQTQSSPMYHQWLTLQQEQTMFGPDPSTVQDTVNYFTSLGFTVGTQGPFSVSFSGTASAVDNAFKTQLNNVQYGSNQLGLVNTLPLALPAPIANFVASVNGLDTATTNIHATSFADPAGLSDFYPSGLPADDKASFTTAFANALYNTSANQSTAYNFTNHAFVWFRYYSHHFRVWKTYQTVTPAALSLMYQAMPLINQGINGDSTGTPVDIAIVMAGGINPGDIQGFSQLVWNNPNQILNRLTAVPVDRQFGLNGTQTYSDGASGEMALDIEFSSTMAPGAHITPVYGPTLAGNILDDVYATIASMAKEPNIVSNSWGGDEVEWPNLYGPNWANALTMHNYFMAISARGGTVLASSADGGGFDKNDGILSGSFPATDPYVFSVDGVRTSALGVGNTVFPTNDSFGSYQENIYTLTNETVHVAHTLGIQSQSFWYEPATNQTPYAPPDGSGGFGTSYWFQQPWYQHGLGVPDVGRALGSSVAAEADFNQTIFFQGYFEWLYGGTSFACPTTAGEFALIEDYLMHNGQSGYLGVGDVPVFSVANAYYNGNVSLVPFYDVTNGTSFWGNVGATKQYSWPAGQVYPSFVSSNGSRVYTYGNTKKGWDFPTGWGTINVYNFARDLLQLDQMPGRFDTINATTNSFDSLEWSQLQLNHTYTLHMNATGAFAASSPHVFAQFFGENGVNSSWLPSTTPVLSPSTGLNFVLNTSASPFGPLFSPGLLILTASNGSTRSAGFAYDWIAHDIPTGNLNVTVLGGSSGGEVGGYSEFNEFLGFAPPTVVPACCGAMLPNTFAVRVTLNGQPVYDAQVVAQIPSAGLLAYSNTRAEQVAESFGNPHYTTTTDVSISYTNLSGIALVYTWNAVAPTPYFVNATYGPNTGGTTYNILPGPTVGTTDNYGGQLSNFNVIAWEIYATNPYRQRPNANQISAFQTNALNQSGYWNLMYGWQGQRLQVNVNNYTGGGINGAKVWLGTFDGGHETRFERFSSTGGVFGVTNYTNTSSTTLPNGTAWLQIPDNMSDTGFFSSTSEGQTAGFGFVAVNVPGASNRTFQYTEKCLPNLPNPNTLITCEFNNSYERNYTSAPIIILPNPINTTVTTPSRLPLDFFSVGANVSFETNVSLPFMDPVAGFNIGYNWPAGMEHITKMQAYVDGHYALDLTPNNPPYWQSYTAYGNLSNNYSPGAHNLTIVVWDSAGHVFTQTKRFVVGGVSITNLGQGNLYTVVPYTVNWTLDLPADQVYNYTYNQTFDLRYVTGGCGGLHNPCATVVNLSERIHDGQINYNQSINLTLMSLDGFYAGNGGSFPTGQYQVIIWLNQNNTEANNSIAAQVNTFLIFDSVKGDITGPGANATVPLGNVTIAYTYSGGYIQTASIEVYAKSDMTHPVFTQGAWQPAVGEEARGNSTTWIAVQTGQYDIVLVLGTPYSGNYTAHEWINVSNQNGLTYLNQSLGQKPLLSLSSAALATIVALVSVLVGLFVGLVAAPALRPTAGGRPAGGSSGPKPWDEGRGASAAGVGNGSPSGAASGGLSCPICHEPASSEYLLHQHQQVVHGIEE